MSDEIDAENVSTVYVVEVSSQAEQAHLKALECILEMGEHYLAEHLLRQAAEVYFELVDCYGNTPESFRARQRLFEMAEHYENIGTPHQARGIYERLL